MLEDVLCSSLTNMTEPKLSKYKDIAQLQRRALSLGQQVGMDAKALELNTEKAWESKVKQGELIKTAQDIFSETSSDSVTLDISPDDPEPMPF